ncbi:MAG: hypothetical protein HN919_08910 [Verrucomicrobia bacterium]|nr:hypothetical protein [Verrucomicrobiota bacterium]MBT7066408.1 hypothetical protein [Verrucomicrobiota bacterium]MBT7701284.1 hypothetical protein [Verrucomicrobiota bacterium]
MKSQSFNSYPSQAREFSQAPFWFWNDELSEAEIARQLDDFQAHSVHAFVIHPRAGLPVHLGWMSDELLKMMRFAIEEAARRDMWVLLYDEAMYPSGSSAGQVAAENPAYACRGLVQVDLTHAAPGETVEGVKIGESGVELADDQTLVAEVTRQHDGHRIVVVDRPVGAVIRGVHFVDEDPARRDDHKEVDENRPLAGDLLNPEAMQCFIRLVYQRYYDEFGEYFGKTIKGVFTDEPGLLGRGGWREINPRPGTSGILEHVNAFLGYDFAPHLPALWDDAEPDAGTYRADYHKALRHRLQETYYAPISEWCAEHGIALTGHPAESTDIGLLRHFQIPGQDVVLRYVEPGKESALVGPHSTMGKCASSAMLHLRRRRNLNEFAGAYGHELTFEEYRWLALWLLIRGCNLLVPHAFYYSVRGPRIDERPRDVGPNSPWWDDYKAFAELTGKLCWLNTDSEQVCDVAILGQHDRLPWKSARVCFEHQIDFNYIEARHFGEDAVVGEGGICIGAMTYGLLIVEKGFGAASSAEAEAAVAQLTASGRSVVWSPDEGEASLLESIRKKRDPRVSVSPACPELRIREVRKDGCDYLVVFNEGETPFAGKLEWRAATSGVRVDMDSGEALEWNSDVEVSLAPHGCMAISGH